MQKSIDEVEAQRRLVPSYYDYYASGAEREWTLRDNTESFSRFSLIPRVLRDVTKVSCATHLFGRSLSSPIVVAPMAFQKLASPEGEASTARAAGTAGVGMCLSTFSTTALEEVGAAYHQTLEIGKKGGEVGSLMMQIYVFSDRAVTEDMVRRAADAGYAAVVVTVDAPVIGVRPRDARNRYIRVMH
jgi:4-hydroxymandelate oxidase